MRNYAKTYLKERIEVFRKDMRICLTGDANGRHAYMPALLMSVSFLDLLACLHIGDMRPRGQKHVLDYVARFMDPVGYQEQDIALLWQMFRHKVAHATQPYGVYDTHSGDKSDNPLHSHSRKWVTWHIYAGDRRPPIELLQNAGVLTERPPWPVSYTHECRISLYRLKVDIPRSVLGADGYLAHIQSSSDGMDRFRECLGTIFPRRAEAKQQTGAS